MLIKANNVCEALVAELDKLPGGRAGPRDISTMAGFDMATRLLRDRERGQLDAVTEQFDDLRALLQQIGNEVGDSASYPSLDTLRGALAAAGAQSDLVQAEAAWREIFEHVEAFALEVGRDATLSKEARNRITVLLCAWEEKERLRGLDGPDISRADDDTVIHAARLQQYLRHRFNDPAMQVTAFRGLDGGFGKQMYLFTTQGEALNGDFVLRRELHGGPVATEYEVLRAVHARGIPGPQALWLDLEHKLLPGGHFLVMRRAPGVTAGDVFGASIRAPADLSRRLARVVAQLHQFELPPELAQLNERVNAAQFERSRGELIREQVEGMLLMLQHFPHVPSPSIAALSQWVIERIPAPSGRPVLLHGDIGFHNLLVEGDEFTLLDWENLHVGDPAEELAYIRNTMGDTLDWAVFMEEYVAAGGEQVEPARIAFFQVANAVRIAAGANMLLTKFAVGDTTDLKALQMCSYVPRMLNIARAHMESYPREA